MKNIVVKFINTLFPYHCRGCGMVGKLLCDDCRKNIGRGVKKSFNLGKLDGLYVVGWREGVLKDLVEEYKFKSIGGISRVLAELLDDIVSKSENMIVVPLPTISRHIRERGFDHTLKLSREFAKTRGFKMKQVLLRVNSTVQVGSDEKKREKQAREAYAVDEKVFEPDKIYLLVDDVWTTGASMRAAAEVLKNRGAARVYGAVIETGR